MTQPNPLDAVETFMERAGQLEEIGIEESAHREEWLDEEFRELKEALAEGNQAMVDDALHDIVWIAWGWGVARRGRKLNRVLADEVTRSNMDKVTPVEDIIRYPNSTKVGKKPGHRDADLASVLEAWKG